MLVCAYIHTHTYMVYMCVCVYISVYHPTHLLPLNMSIEKWNINSLQSSIQCYGGKKQGKQTTFLYLKFIIKLESQKLYM